MERAQHHRFIDLAAPAADDASVELEQRRRFMRQMGLAAFAASATPAAFAQAMDRYHPDAPPTRYPEPGRRRARQALQVQARQHADPAALHAACCGPRVRPGAASADTCVWSDIPNDEQLRWLRGRRPRRPALPLPVEQHQRQHLRLPGPADLVLHTARAMWSATSTTARSPCSPTSIDGKQFNAPNDAMVHPDGWHLVHRPGLRQPDGLRGQRLPQSATTLQPIQKEAVYRIDASRARSTRSPTRCSSRTACASRPTTRGCTSPTPARRTTRSAEEHHLGLRRRRQEAQEPAARSPSMELDGKAGFADGIRCDEDGNIWAGRLGRRRLRRRPRLRIPTARASARSGCPRSAPTSASAAPSATACS